MSKRWIVIALSLAAASCNATAFKGDAQFPEGPKGCASRCRADGLEMSAFVYAGEYSSACVCQPPAAKTTQVGANGAVGAAGVGVVLQMRAAQQQQQAAMHH
jgi:hypothetical protein